MKKIIIFIALCYINLVSADEIKNLYDYNNVVENSDAVSIRPINNLPVTTTSKIYSFVKIHNDTNWGRAEVLSVIDKKTNSGEVIEPLGNIYKRAYRGLIVKDNLLYLFILEGNSLDGTLQVWTVDVITDKARKVSETDISNVSVLRHSLRPLFRINEHEFLIQPKNSEITVYNTLSDTFRTESILPLSSVDGDPAFGLNNSMIYYDLSKEKLLRADTDTADYTVLSDKPGRINYLGTFGDRGYFLKKNSNQVVEGCCYTYNLYSTDGHSIRLEFEGYLADNIYSQRIQKIGDKLFFMQISSEKKLLFKSLGDDKFNSISPSFNFSGHSVHGFALTEHNGNYYILGGVYDEGSGSKLSSIIEINLQSGFKIINTKEYESGKDSWAYIFSDGPQLSLIENVYDQTEYGKHNPYLTNCYKVNPNNGSVEHTGVISNFKFHSKIEESSEQHVFAKSVEYGIEPRYLSCRSNQSYLIKDFNTTLKNGSAEFSYVNNHNYTFNLYEGLFDLTEELFSLDGEQVNKVDVRSIQSSYLGFRAKLRLVENDYLYLNIYLHEEKDLGWGPLGGASYFPFALNLKTGESTFLAIGFAGNVKFHRGNFIHSIPVASGEYVKLESVGVNGTKELRLPANLTDFIPYKDYILAYGASSARGAYNFAKLKDDKIIGEFTIDCAGSCQPLMVRSVGGSVLISPSNDSVVGNTYLYQFDSIEDPVKIYDGNPEDVTLIASEGSYSLVTITGDEQNEVDTAKRLYRFNHLDNSFTEVYADIGNLVRVKSIGNYFVGITESKKLLAFDDKFNLIKTTGIPNANEYKTLSEDNYFECNDGVCYLALMTGQGEATNLLKLNSQLEVLDLITLNVNIHATISKKKNYLLLDAENERWGREVFILNRVINDSDSDGMDDDYERAFDFDPTDANDSALDADKDGVSNIDEYIRGLNPHQPDTDSDGYSDGEEISSQTNPLEYDLHLTDRDSDGIFDSEDRFPFDRSEWSDNDSDGVGDNADTDDDNDGIPDEWEERYGLDPLSSEDRDLDPDNDGKSNYQEYQAGTDPTVSNTGNSDDDSPGNDSGDSGGGGGSTPIWLLTILLFTLTARRYYK